MKNLLFKILPKTLTIKLRTASLGYKLLTENKSHLSQLGFASTWINNKPLDQSGQPIPWMNYQIIDFLKERLRKEHMLFEYGAGFSSMFFSKLVKQVHSVEYDKKWYDILKLNEDEIPNFHLQYIEGGNEYSEAIKNCGLKFDIIVIDGKMRVECANFAIEYLNDNGVIILDDSDRGSYFPIFSQLKSLDYKKIKFSGLKPASFQRYETTIFYKSQANTLDI
jgi:precorrin-6B methylase 2